MLNDVLSQNSVRNRGNVATASMKRVIVQVFRAVVQNFDQGSAGRGLSDRSRSAQRPNGAKWSECSVTRNEGHLDGSDLSSYFRKTVGAIEGLQFDNNFRLGQVQ